MTPRTAQGPVANPIADCLKGGTVGPSTHNLGKAFKERSAIGDSAVQADVPTDTAVQDYLPWLESFEPTPALNLYSAFFRRSPARR